MIRTGVVLPTFRDSPDEAFVVAREAFAAGVDGVFCWDHLWPIGQPDRPALAPFPILADLAVSAAEVAPTAGGGPYFGTLVARVGLVPNHVLLAEFRALAGLAALAGGRVIAGLGTGDRLSEAENRAFGIPYGSAAERRSDMVALANVLREMGLTVWLAGGTAARLDESRAAGVGLNVWDAPPSLVAARAEGPDTVEVTWGGPPLREESTLRQAVAELAHAGATWVIFASPVDLDALVAAARAVNDPVRPDDSEFGAT